MRNASKKPLRYVHVQQIDIKIDMNHPQRHRDYPDEDYDSLVTAHAFLRDAAAETRLS
jgi:hypothetical protein